MKWALAGMIPGRFFSNVKMRSECLAFKIQKIVKRKRLMNMFVKKAAKRPALQDALTDALASKEAQKKLHSPLWLFRNIIL